MNVKVNGVDYPLKDQNGLLVIEDGDGTQYWAMVQHATVNYVDQEIVSDREFRMELQVTLAPGQTLVMADSTDADEENVLVYSRLLVALLREERERYDELERKLRLADRERHEQAAAMRTTERDQAEMLHVAWRYGAKSGYGGALAEQGLIDLLKRNPHPLPEDEQDDEDGL